MARLTPPKSPLVSDKSHSGCMWSLYSLFEFRHGNSKGKLLSDRKRLKRENISKILWMSYKSSNPFLLFFIFTKIENLNVRTFADDGNVKQHDLLAKFDVKSQARDVSSINIKFFCMLSQNYDTCQIL